MSTPLLTRTCTFLDILGLTWFVPPLKIACGVEPKYEARRLLRMVGLPVAALALFIASWYAASGMVTIGSSRLPGPAQVSAAASSMVAEYVRARASYAEYQQQFAAARAQNPELTAQQLAELMPYTATPTYIDQIITSLKTVFTGFLIACAIAIPLGILCGMNTVIFEMVNPFIQIFKPVSPLAWLPIVTIIVGATMASAAANAMFSKSYVIAAAVVALCSLWPTLINTANGVANVDRDHLNVARVLNLGWFSKVFKVVLPAALPQIFNGMRLSIGVGWMVLIAAEMLSQNPGLGKFIWDVYQSSNDSSLALIMVAVLTIGLIGFVLDRLMIAVQRLVSPGALIQVR